MTAVGNGLGGDGCVRELNLIGQRRVKRASSV